jgi:hypothetical protein
VLALLLLCVLDRVRDVLHLRPAVREKAGNPGHPRSAAGHDCPPHVLRDLLLLLVPGQEPHPVEDEDPRRHGSLHRPVRWLGVWDLCGFPVFQFWVTLRSRTRELGSVLFPGLLCGQPFV